MRQVIDHIMRVQHCNLADADYMAVTAGHNTPEGEALLDDLFGKVSFSAGVRESLIATITAAYCWSLDADLNQLPNPWEPLVELYGTGYTTSYDDDADDNGTVLLVGFNGGIARHRIV